MSMCMCGHMEGCPRDLTPELRVQTSGRILLIAIQTCVHLAGFS